MNKKLTGLAIVLSFLIGFCFGKQLYEPTGIKKKIVAAFDDVDWSRQSFVCGGAKMSDKNNNTSFYPTREIDNAITKLNEILEKIK